MQSKRQVSELKQMSEKSAKLKVCVGLRRLLIWLNVQVC